jgi:hypothetical protein
MPVDIDAALGLSGTVNEQVDIREEFAVSSVFYERTVYDVLGRRRSGAAKVEPTLFATQSFGRCSGNAVPSGGAIVVHRW